MKEFLFYIVLVVWIINIEIMFIIDVKLWLLVEVFFVMLFKRGYLLYKGLYNSKIKFW